MKKKTITSLVVIVAVIAVVLLVGFYEGNLPFTEEYKERELVKQWIQMYGECDPELDDDSLDEFMEELETRNIHPEEIYRGSMIFYEKSYGYIYIPDFVDDELRGLPHDMTEEKFIDLAKKNGGETTMIHVFEQDMWCACFPTLKEAEHFLAELWSFEITTSSEEKVSTPAPTPVGTPTPTLFEINYPVMATWENLEGDYDRIQMTLYKDGTGFYDASFEDISEIQYVTWEVKERTVSKIRYRFEFTDHTGTYSGYFALYSNHNAYWDPGTDNLLGTWR